MRSFLHAILATTLWLGSGAANAQCQGPTCQAVVNSCQEPNCPGVASVTITSPANGATAYAPGAFTLAADVETDTGTASVDFSVNAVSVGVDNTAPYSVQVTGLTPGAYTLKAKVVGSLGSDQVSVTVLAAQNVPPSVSLTSPVNGATGAAPATFSLAASASDSDGTVQSVKFYADGALLSTDVTAPFTGTYSTSATGTHSLTAVATDNSNATTTSAAVAVTVSVTGGSGGQVSTTRSYVYDQYHQLCKTLNPESGATIIEYNAAGSVLWTADGLSQNSTSSCDRSSVVSSQQTVRSYDARNRVIGVSTPGGTANTTTTYFPDGAVNTVTAANPGGYGVTTTYTYNKRRLLTNESSSNGSSLLSLAYGYNANGHLATTTYPDTQVIEYLPDALGRPTKVGVPGGQTYASGVTYFPTGAISGFTYGNGIVHTMTPNVRQLPGRSLDQYSTTKVLDDNYVYDANGNVDLITDAAGTGTNNRTRDLGYDGLDRLLVADAPNQWGTASYTYDALDNLRTADLNVPGVGVRRFRYTYNDGAGADRRLASISNASSALAYTFGYDANGNVTAKTVGAGCVSDPALQCAGKPSQALVFDAANRLSQVTGVQTYRYDGLGRRVQTTDANGQTTFWMYSQSGQVMYTSEARRSQNLSYYYLGNTQVGTKAVAWGTGAVSIRFQHTDALGSPVIETDPARNVTDRNSFTAWGEPWGATQVDGTGYTGHVMDQGTGLTYMQQRYYDPAIGRFLSNDPVGTNSKSGGNFNRYSYASNNPYKFTDPDGRQSQDFNCPQCTAAQEQHAAASSALADGDQKRMSDALSGTIPIAPMTRSEIADRADNVATAASVVEVSATLAGQPEVAGPAGVVSVGATLVATIAKPTPERKQSLALAVVTAGAAKGLGAMGEVIPSKAVTVGADIVELTKAATKEDDL